MPTGSTLSKSRSESEPEAGYLPTGAGVERAKALNQQFASTQHWHLIELRDTASAGYLNDVLLVNHQTGLCLNVDGTVGRPGTDRSLDCQPNRARHPPTTSAT